MADPVELGPIEEVSSYEGEASLRELPVRLSRDNKNVFSIFISNPHNRRVVLVSSLMALATYIIVLLYMWIHPEEPDKCAAANHMVAIAWPFFALGWTPHFLLDPLAQWFLPSCFGQ